MGRALEAMEVTVDCFHKRDTLRRLMGPQKWAENLRPLIQIVRKKMVEDKAGAMTTALALAVESQDDPRCPDMLPFMFICAGMDLVSKDKCEP